MIWLFFGVFLTLFFATLLGELLSRRVNTERTRTVVDTLNARIRSWWWMCGVIVLAVLAGNTGAVVLFGLVSFLALREFITLTPTRQADHAVLCWCFFVFLPVLKSGGFDAFYYLLLFYAGHGMGADFLYYGGYGVRQDSLCAV